MKNSWKLLLVICLVAALLLGCGAKVEEEVTEPEEAGNPFATEAVTYPYDFTSEDFFYIKDCLNYIPSASVSGVKEDGSFFNMETYRHEATGEDFYVMQGGCTDGKYAYLVLEGSSVLIDGENYSKAHVVSKVDMATWEVVAISEPMSLGHGNGMCYNPNLNQLVISMCNDVANTTDLDETKCIAFVDADTLELVEVRELALAINAIDYNPKQDLYVVGIKGNSAAFAVLDSDFVELGWYPGNNCGLGSQDVDCDDNYIYVGNSGVGVMPGMEVVKVYDWNGEYVGIFRVDSVSEQEALFNYDGQYYITFYTGNGGRIFKINYDFSLLGQISE